MSEGGEDYQENFDAQSDDNHSAEEPWQMQHLHELLSLPSVEGYTDSELQHILALHGALRKIVHSFYEAYAAIFQGIHEQSQIGSSGITPTTVQFSKEFYLSMPTPFEEIVLAVDTKIRGMQNSGRFPGFDFERHIGNLSVIQDPNLQEPRSEEIEEKLNTFRNAVNIRQDRYDARWEACLTNTHFHDLIRLPPLRSIQRSSSSADHDAEQSRRRLIQASGGGQETLPQTPIRGTPQMLGTFTWRDGKSLLRGRKYHSPKLTIRTAKYYDQF